MQDLLRPDSEIMTRVLTDMQHLAIMSKSKETSVRLNES